MRYQLIKGYDPMLLDTVSNAPIRTKHRPRFRQASVEERPAFRVTDRDREGFKIIYENRSVLPAPMLDIPYIIR